MDVHSQSPYPSCALSNYALHEFTFDGVRVASMEGLLQAFKFDKVYMQIAVCGNVGQVAKQRAQGRNKHWQRSQTLWWNGRTYDRHSDDYQDLLNRAYMALFENADFRQALLDSGTLPLTHKIGRSDPHETVLTERELCERLTQLREFARQKEHN